MVFPTLLKSGLKSRDETKNRYFPSALKVPLKALYQFSVTGYDFFCSSE